MINVFKHINALDILTRYTSIFFFFYRQLCQLWNLQTVEIYCQYTQSTSWNDSSKSTKAASNTSCFTVKMFNLKALTKGGNTLEYHLRPLSLSPWNKKGMQIVGIWVFLVHLQQQKIKKEYVFIVRCTLQPCVISCWYMTYGYLACCMSTTLYKWWRLHCSTYYLNTFIVL